MKSHERERMEKLVRSMARPPIAEERLALLPDGSIRLQLKTNWRDGTQFLLFTQSEFIEKLIALVPLPKFHLTRYYGVFAKASKYRDKCKSRMRLVAVVCGSPTILSPVFLLNVDWKSMEATPLPQRGSGMLKSLASGLKTTGSTTGAPLKTTFSRIKLAGKLRIS